MHVLGLADAIEEHADERVTTGSLSMGSLVLPVTRLHLPDLVPGRTTPDGRTEHG